MPERRNPLPPLPDSPKRTLSEPARRTASGTFPAEEPTPVRNAVAAAYQSLILTFDALTPAARLDFADLLDLWSGMSPQQRERVKTFARSLTR